VEEGLAAELRRRSAADQKARERLPSRVPSLGWMSKKAERAADALRVLDEDNAAWLKEVVRSQGWPGRSLVGEESAHAAWLLVQHADHDPAFQRECLDLLEKAVQRGEASASDWASARSTVKLRAGLRNLRRGRPAPSAGAAGYPSGGVAQSLCARRRRAIGWSQPARCIASRVDIPSPGESVAARLASGAQLQGLWIASGAPRAPWSGPRVLRGGLPSCRLPTSGARAT